MSLWARGLSQCTDGWLSLEKGHIKGSIVIKVVHVLLAGIEVISFPYWNILKTKTKLFSFKGYLWCSGFNELARRASVVAEK